MRRNIKLEALIVETLEAATEPLTVNEIYDRIGFKTLNCDRRSLHNKIRGMKEVQKVKTGHKAFKSPKEVVKWRLISRTPSQE